MARTGLYKSDVKKARDALLAQQRHPSVDAVRVALGNTGSKTTIHKYLRELEEEQGGPDGRRVAISEALQDLVGRLSAQLQDEANQQIETIRTQSAASALIHDEALNAAQQEAAALKHRLTETETLAGQEKAAHDQTREALQREAIARHTAEQQVRDLKERLAENDAHRRSLEEKHQHAREALEHYRQSVKEQRDQDQRRHEQQIQQVQAEMRQLQQSLVVKQDAVTRLNQEGARLVAELSHAQTALHDEQDNNRRMAQKLEALQALEQRCSMLESQASAGKIQAAAKDSEVQTLKDALTAAASKSDALTGQVRELELACTTANAKLDAQQSLVSELRAYLDARDRPLMPEQVGDVEGGGDIEAGGR